MNSANCTWSLLSSTPITRRAGDVEECHRRRSGVLVLLQTSPVSVILLHINDRNPPPSVRPPTESWRGTEPLSVCMTGLRRRPNLRPSVQPTKPCIILPNSFIAPLSQRHDTSENRTQYFSGREELVFEMRKPMSKATIASTSSPNRGATPQPVAQKLTTVDITAENAQVHAPAHVRRRRSVRARRDKGKAPASTRLAQSESVENPVFMKVKFPPNETLQFQVSFEVEPLEDMDSKVMKITVSTLKTVKETDTSKLLDLATVCCEPGVS